jgi:hypothetical protein
MLKTLHGAIASSFPRGPQISLWDLSNASYNGVGFDHGVAGGMGVFFKDDGLKVYMIGSTGAVNQFDLTVAWDLSTATTVGTVAFDVTSQDPFPHDIFFRDDGLRMYMTGGNTNKIYEYTLTVAWDLSTATTAGLVTSPTLDQAAFPSGLFIKPDGTKMYKTSGGASLGSVYQYSINTAWDISSIVDDGVSFQAGGEAVFFKSDGLRMFVTTPDLSSEITQFDLSGAWDLSTATNTGSVDFGIPEDGDMRGAFFAPSGERFYACGTWTVPRKIYQYDL